MSVLHLIAFLSVGILLSLAALVCLAGGRGDAFAGFKAFRRSRGRFDKVALAVLASLLMFFAGAKHGGTNGVDQTGGGASTNAPPSGPMMSLRRPVASAPPSADPGFPTGISSDAIDLGLVLARIGTNEVFDFSRPEGFPYATNWMIRGAATDGFKCRMTDGEGDVFRFPFGTNVVENLFVLSEGCVWMYGTGVAPHLSSFSIFHSSSGLGVVPEFNWRLLNPTNLPCQVWYGPTDDDTFAVTWQNVLLGRVPENPVSFQIRFRSNGDVECRYDLSNVKWRMENGDCAGDSAFSNIVVGVRNGGAQWMFDRIPTNLTSLTFARLTEADRTDPDRDGDGLPTADELFTYRTDPGRRDTDLDGLSDHDEIFIHRTDPLDPNSLRPDMPDGMAVVIGAGDPFALPFGSTNTVWEHAYYTGTTNAPFARPVAGDDANVLEVTVSGTGSGRLVLGDDLVVPLLARPRPLLAGPLGLGPGDDPTANTLRVSVPKGVILHCALHVPATLAVQIRAADFTYGHAPTFFNPRGWFAFPNTKAAEPCIHDLGTQGVSVALDPGIDAHDLTCTWNEAADIAVVNRPPLAARLTGSFPRNATTPITYTLAHPLYLSGATNYTQTARFCPALAADGVEDGEAVQM